MDLWWPTLFGSMIPLIVCIICFPVSARQKFSKQVIQALEDAEETLKATLKVLFTTDNVNVPLDDLTRLRLKFFQNSKALPELLGECLFEFSYDYVGVNHIAPFVNIIDRIRVSLSNGSNDLIDTSIYYNNGNDKNNDILGLNESTEDEIECVEEIKRLINIMHKLILNSLSLVRRILNLALKNKNCNDDISIEDIDLQKQLLKQCAINCRKDIHNILIKHLTQLKPNDQNTLFKKHLCILSYYSVMLFKLSADLIFALQTSSDILNVRHRNRRKIHFPSHFLNWLKAPSTSQVGHEFGLKPDLQDDILTSEQSEQERHRYSFEEELQLQAYASYAIRRSHLKQGKISLRYWFLNIWDSPGFLKSRLYIYRLLTSFIHSRHLQFALKNAAGVGFLSIPGFLPHGTKGQTWFFEEKGVWMVISYFYVLEPSTGATYRVGLWRIMGTILGAVFGFLVNLITKGNPIGITVLVTFISIIVACIVRMSSVPGVGTVLAVTFPPIIFPVYLDTANFASFTIALTRAYMIAIGIIAAVIINHIWCPFHAREKFTLQVSKSLSEMSKLYLIISRQSLGVMSIAAGRLQFDLTEKRVQGALNRCDALLEPLRSELSIIPKPLTLYRKMISSLQRTHDLLISLKYVRERIIQKETILDIKDQRLNFINALILVFYATTHAFRSSTPLPQFLPSLHTALNDMLTAIDEKLGEVLLDDEFDIRRQIEDYRLQYSLSEAEILLGLVNAVEDMLTISKSLFGQTSIFEDNSNTFNDDIGNVNCDNYDTLPLHSLNNNLIGFSGWSISPVMQYNISPVKTKWTKGTFLEKKSKKDNNKNHDMTDDAFILNYSPQSSSSRTFATNSNSNSNSNNSITSQLPPRTNSKKKNYISNNNNNNNSNNLIGIPLEIDLFNSHSNASSDSGTSSSTNTSPSSMSRTRIRSNNHN